MWSSVSAVTITTSMSRSGAQRHESFLAVVEAAILEGHRLPRLDHLRSVGQVEAMLLEIARLFGGIEAVAHGGSVCIKMCIVKLVTTTLHACAYFSPSWTPFQADRGRDSSVIVDDGGGAQVIF